MAIANLNNYQLKDGIGFPQNFRRGNPNPLDNSSLWGSLEAAQTYATNNAVAYVGQILTVLNSDAEGNVLSASAYIIQNTDGTLKPVGTEIKLDANTLITNSSEEVTIKGYETAETGAQLVKTADGLSWVVPSTSTIEGLQTTIATLQTNIGDANSGLTKQVNDNTAAINILNGTDTTEGSVAYQIAQIVANAPESYDTLKEIADWITNDTTGAASMSAGISENAAAIQELTELVGDTAVATQISTAITEALQVDGADKYALASSLTTLAGRVTANENALTILNGSATTEGSVKKTVTDAIDAALKTDGADKYAAKTHTHIIGDVNGLQEALNAKASQYDMTQAQSDITSLLEDQHDHTNKTVLDSITQDKVTAWDAAQTNVIEKIKLNNVELTVDSTDKSVNIPLASTTNAGAVKVNGTDITIQDGTIGIGTVEVSKLYVADGNNLILDGGTSAI